MRSNYHSSDMRSSAYPRISQSRRLSHLALGFVCAVLSLMFWSAPVRLNAAPAQTTTYIYLYTPLGYVDVTNSTFNKDGHVYITSGGVTFEVFLDHEEGHVFDLTKSQIGFLLDKTSA